MKRYFVIFVTLAAILLGVAFLSGIEFLYQRSQENTVAVTEQARFTLHMGLALAASLFTLLVHCIVFTYLLGTGKWVKEVASAYGMSPDGWPEQTKQFKIRVNRWLLTAMFITIAATVTGAGAQVEVNSWWSIAHPLLAVAVLFANGWAFKLEYGIIKENEVVLRSVKEEADRMKAASDAAES
jgi:hypothetical protein